MASQELQRLLDECTLPCCFVLDADERAALTAAIDALQRQGEWIPVSERLPEDGELVLVYTPDRGDGERMDFDWRDDGSWSHHNDCYEHFMAVGGASAAGPDCVCIGPSEEAPYTHWKRELPPQPPTGEQTS